MADIPAANSDGEYAAEGKIPALRYKSKAGRGHDQQSSAKAAIRLGSSGCREKRQKITIYFLRDVLETISISTTCLPKGRPGEGHAYILTWK